MEDAFSSWSWDIVLYAMGLALLVFLVMGPAMWSSTNEFMVVRLWRLLRGKSKTPKSQSGDSASGGTAP